MRGSAKTFQYGNSFMLTQLLRGASKPQGPVAEAGKPNQFPLHLRTRHRHMSNGGKPYGDIHNRSVDDSRLSSCGN